MSYNPIKLYEISERFITYMILHLNDPKTGTTPVYSNHIAKHTRKYLSLQIQLNGYNYYIPLSSGRNKDYFIDSVTGLRAIRKDVTTIWRIKGFDVNGLEEVKASIIFGSMLPAPNSDVLIYDVDSELDINYKNLVLEELRYISTHREKIEKNAARLYKFRIESKPIDYLKYTVDFLKAETLVDVFVEIDTSSIEA